MRRLLLCLCSLVYAQDEYVFTGHFEKMTVYQHDHMLLIKNAKKLALVEQPSTTTVSYLSDISRSDAILEVKEGSYCVIRQQENLKVACHDQEDESAKLHILVDAGHGGKDGGATATNGLKEKHVTLSYAKKLARYLEDTWIKVDLTRMQDVYVDKYDRLKMALKLQPDILLSVHADAFEKPSASGVGLFYLNESLGSALSQKLIAGYQSSKNMRLLSKQLADSILTRLKGEYKLHVSEAQSLPLVILRSPVSISMLLELGFLSNPEEAGLLGSENYLEGFAEDMAGILLDSWKKKEDIIFIASFD